MTGKEKREMIEDLLQQLSLAEVCVDSAEECLIADRIVLATNKRFDIEGNGTGALIESAAESVEASRQVLEINRRLADEIRRELKSAREIKTVG